jgi:2-phosphoglycerate kinase
MRAVSEIILGLLAIHKRRGESVILEGMHFDDQFIGTLSKWEDVLLICLNNTLPFSEKVLLKSKTRDRVEFVDTQSGEIRYGSITSEDVDKTPYIEHADRINEIHEEILESFRRHSLRIIDFTEIEHAIESIIRLIE